jgi:DNA repair protein RadC
MNGAAVLHQSERRASRGRARGDERERSAGLARNPLSWNPIMSQNSQTFDFRTPVAHDAVTPLMNKGFQEAPLCTALPASDAELLMRLLPPAAKPLAQPLLARFGSLAETVCAPLHLLWEIAGMTRDTIVALKLIEAATGRITSDAIVRRPVVDNWAKVMDYLRANMAFAEIEQFRILFLDKRNHLIADEVMQQGTIDHCPVYPREVCKRALELSATAVILVHNHPSGDPTPSQADISMTKDITDAAKILGIAVHDHIVIGREGHASLKAMGLF